MSTATIDYRDCDRQIWEEELADFVPDRILDAHIHLFNREDFKELPPAFADHQDNNLSDLNAWSEVLYPGRRVNYLILGYPSPQIDTAHQVRFVKSQIEQMPSIRHNRLVTPSCRIEDIERDLEHPQIVGLKPYRVYSVTGDIAQCRIHDFLPHEQMEVANERGLWVTMHLSRHHGCADPHNLDDLEEYTTRRYPNIRWLLAHCARSFTYWAIEHAIDRLRDMPNIHYDTSAVTDVRPYVTLLTKENTQRIFWGSDGVSAAFFHGYYAAMGRAWQHYDADKAGLKFPHCNGRPILSVYEQLMALKFASGIAQLSRDQIEGIFWRNATTALGIE